MVPKYMQWTVGSKQTTAVALAFYNILYEKVLSDFRFTKY